MVKFLLPSASSYASATYDGKLIFYLGKTVNVYDTSIREKVAMIPRLGNSQIAVSRDNAFVGCIHPTSRVVEAVLLRMNNPPKEMFRIPLRGSFHSCAPCFTYDNNYLLVTVGYPKVVIYAIEVSTGTVFSMYETTETSTISNLIVTAKGIIAVEHESLLPSIDCPSAKFLLFQTVFSSPVEICFDKRTCDSLRKELKSSFVWSGAVELTQEKLLLFYKYASHTAETRFEVRSLQYEPTFRPAPNIIIPYFLSLPPVVTTDGKYVAFIGKLSKQTGDFICVYQTADWSPVLIEHQKYVWDLHFIPNTYDLIVSGEKSYVLTINVP